MKANILNLKITYSNLGHVMRIIDEICLKLGLIFYPETVHMATLFFLASLIVINSMSKPLRRSLDLPKHNGNGS